MEDNYRELHLLEQALDALRLRTGIVGHLLEHETRHRDAADAFVELESETGRYTYFVECKFNVDRKSIIAQVKLRFADLPQPGMLIAPYISREMAEYCRELKVQFLDTHGNAYLQAPGMHIYIKGERSEVGRQTQKEGRSANSAAALRVLFVLLCQPHILRESYRDIAQCAGVSLGSIGGVLDALEKRGLMLGAEKKHVRRLLEPARLLDEWVVGYLSVLRPKLEPRRFSAIDAHWWHAADLSDFDAAWGGEVAAQRMTNYLVPVTQTIYVNAKKRSALLKYLIGTYRLKSDPHGSIEILDRFWHFPEESHHDTVPAVLVYADLMATFDPRTAETANIIREHNIEHAFRPG